MSRIFLTQKQTFRRILAHSASAEKLVPNRGALSSKLALDNHRSTSTVSIAQRQVLHRPVSKHQLPASLFYFRAMSTSTSNTDIDPAVSEILKFWLEDLGIDDWFRDSAKHDETITKRFGHLVEKAVNTNELDKTWTSTPSGSLALVILLDQFTRNTYRAGKHENPGLSFSGDAKALKIAGQSIAKGYDLAIQAEKSDTKGLGLTYRSFFYLPFMHAEDLSSQIAAVSLYENMLREREVVEAQKRVDGGQETEVEKGVREWLIQGVNFAKKHRDCVAQLGRFPKRNGPLGREDTEEEKKFLEEHPMGF